MGANWTPNGYGLHYLTPVPPGVMAVVEDHWTRVEGVFIRCKDSVLRSGETFSSVADAKAWCEAKLAEVVS